FQFPAMIGFLIQNPPFLKDSVQSCRCFPLRRTLSPGAAQAYSLEHRAFPGGVVAFAPNN
ncbi:MAG: hypothetical protein ABS884_10420, partial [Solibacillus isronensis]